MSEQQAEVVSLPFVTPEFNQADFVVDDLCEKNAALTKENSILRSQVKQLDELIKANADKLGLQVNEDGSMSPVDQPAPNRAARRANTRSKS